MLTGLMFMNSFAGKSEQGRDHHWRRSEANLNSPILARLGVMQALACQCCYRAGNDDSCMEQDGSSKE